MASFQISIDLFIPFHQQHLFQNHLKAQNTSIDFGEILNIELKHIRFHNSTIEQSRFSNQSHIEYFEVALSKISPQIQEG